MAKVSWVNLDATIMEAIRGLEAHGFKEPTIRSVYYVLGSQNIIPLTDSGYKSLDAKIVEMRKAGTIPWGFFAVKRGTSDEAGTLAALPGGFQATVPYVEPKAWADFWTIQAKDAHETFHLPRWYEQDNLVEVWVEKDGLLGATSSWLQEEPCRVCDKLASEVTVRAPQGYGAWEFLHSSMKKIKAELKKQRKKAVHIIYLGDLDPSGKDIPRFMEEDALAHFEDVLGVAVDFQEIALSPEQVEAHDLPQTPESEEVMAKILRDPRLEWYRERYPPDTFVELDAFYALATDAARELIRSSVARFFDAAKYEATRDLEEEYREQVRERVRSVVTFPDEE